MTMVHPPKGTHMRETDEVPTGAEPTAADRPEGRIEVTPRRSVGQRVSVLAGLAVGAAMSMSTMSISTVSSVSDVVG